MALNPDDITKGMWVKENRQGAERRKVTQVRGNMVSTITPRATGGYSGGEEFHASKLVRADLDDCAAAMDSLAKRVDAYVGRRADALPPKYGAGAKEYYVIHYTINGRTQRYEVNDRSKADAKVKELWGTKGVTDVDLVVKQDK